ncbi:MULTISPECIES: murein hydrolase activator EnvC family protein [Azospirillum]|uniref:Peptidoglycan DD-metalloendopeptidase family protein n=2 Tax=Azospirillum brasilense TaxID=192 RepID=A0ABU4PEF9_AZOBR|nr:MULTISPECIES: peptidoglycan DD-metalloendopeptidase family protein [Azospirillum]MDW7552449.1 peptidoglycan DD-metalloendopeptidase family protein [Azospirillum brasilense]MDW7592361.1 peptidoglycan DD-metalloendopeptidase family protein [Azospirillum brasilense]MDW7627491.1 peptidoglycan DD-metalloendopeptidase family protein [Azospirillum brasilense]MDW7628944.1 peptidoglycan DD-metalloendopeptidase family protein [Azospirillum brasilense]MDX5954820.1 peptidoglycan DD-metalloendopeptidase
MGAGRDHPAGVALLPLPVSVPQGAGRRRALSWRPALLTVALLVISAAAAAQTESPGQTLKRVEQDLQTDKALQRQLDRQSQTLQKELDELRDRLVGLADQERAQEDELAHLEESLTALETQERNQAEKLEGERQQIAALLAALQRVARIPPEAALARPDGPVDTLRSALLLRDTVPALRARADALAQALTRLAETREALQAQRSRTYAARLTLIDRQKEIGQLVARREELSRQTEEERQQIAQRTARLTGQAADLRQLMDRIEAERRAAAAMAAKREAERLEAERREAERRLAEQRAAEQKAAEQKLAEQKAAEQRAAEQKLADQRASEQRARAETETARAAPSPPTGERLPVGGRVTVRYGEADRYGATSRGVTIQARAGSTVVSPQAGTIVFAGPFRGYGQILIVEHSHGYHSLIAGFGRIDTAVGRRVATGEPIGLMPADGSPDLYFELRRHGQPINPQRGFGAPEGKGQG